MEGIFWPMLTGGVIPPPFQLVIFWSWAISAGRVRFGPDGLGRLLEGEAGRPGQDAEDVVVAPGATRFNQLKKSCMPGLELASS